MDKVVIYIHGKGGNAEESVHYKSLFSDCDVVGLNYTAQYPWEAKKEFPPLFDLICKNYKSFQIVANSIGAYFAMNALSGKQIEKAYFISPIVNMEQLIVDMMFWANVTEEQLRLKKIIPTSFGQTLTWEYWQYAVNHPILRWNSPTKILYGEHDKMIDYSSIEDFSKKFHCATTVMKHGEHWFHTEEQMDFLGSWISNNFQNRKAIRLER